MEGALEAPVDTAAPTLSEVMPSALAGLGVDGFTDTLGFGDLSRMCVLLVDGLGWESLRGHAADAPFLTSLGGRPIRSGYPATTAAGLAAIGTGVRSGEHGLVGYSFAVPGTGVLNALRWCRHPGGEDLTGVLPVRRVQPLPTTFARAAEAGITTTVVSAPEFEHTPLTEAVLSGGAYVGARALGGLTAAVLAALREPGSLCYAYHGDLDQLGHVHGPGSPAWRWQLRHVDRLVESLAEGLPPGARLAVVADHGMVELDHSVFDADTDPALREGVRELAGEVRARHVYTEPGAVGDVLAAWRETARDRAWVVSREDAVDRGWFGPTVAEHVLPRIGDVVVAARGRSGVVRREAEPVESALLGQHGSLTDAEQLVPLLVAGTT